MGGVVVGIGGGADQGDARGFHIDEEQAVGAGMGAAGELGLEDEMIGVIGAGDMPFLAVQDVIPALAPGRRLDRVDVRAGLGLGDGIAFMALAADVRFDPGLHLMRRAGAGLDHPGRSRAVAPAQRIGDLADLLLDDDLLEEAEAGSAEVAGDGQRIEPDLLGDALVPRPDFRRQLAAVHLRRDLMGDQLLCDEAAHLLLPGTRGRGQGIGHGRRSLKVAVVRGKDQAARAAARCPANSRGKTAPSKARQVRLASLRSTAFGLVRISSQRPSIMALRPRATQSGSVSP